MHDQLSARLGMEVVGEVTRVGDAFFDVGLGRVALPDLDLDRIGALLAQVRETFGERLQVTDRLHLREQGKLIRGLVEVSIRPEGSSAPYLLQLSTPALLAFYHRRFLLEKDVLGDLGGMLCRGLARLVAEGQGPLRVLSRFQELEEGARKILDQAVQEAVAGRSFDPAPAIAEMVPRLREAWRLIPWSLRQGITPCSRLEQDRITAHDRELRRTLLLAVEQATGKVDYQYVHQHNPLEEYDQVLTWLTEVHQAMVTTYAPPAHATAVARASSLEQFRDCYPGFRALLGPRLPGGGEGQH